jgi:hypothetical protein
VMMSLTFPVIELSDAQPRQGIGLGRRPLRLGRNSGERRRRWQCPGGLYLVN